MDLRKVEYFLKAVEYENFTKAAESCNIAQTTMSKYIQTLENEIGFALFIRDKKEIHLTPKGKEFYQGIQQIQTEYLALLQSIREEEHKELHIGIALQDYLELPILKKFEDTHTDIPIYYAYIQNLEDLNLMENGKLDAIIMPDALAIPEQYEHTPILKLRQSLVCSKSNLKQYATAQAIIANLPMITKSSNRQYHEHCKENFQQIFGVQPKEIIVCQTLPEQLLQIGLSKGFGILPFSENTTFEGLHALPLGNDFTESTQLIYPQDHQSQSMRTLLSFIHEKKC